jgi:uncharacterized membrane protein YccC
MGVGGSAQTLIRTGTVWSRFRDTAVDLLNAEGPALLFGFRLWASVCLALFVAYYLELDNASWAGTSAAIMCQPQLGASLRKGWFLMIGTIIGAIMIVALTGAFPQDRVAYLGLLTVWCGLCAYLASQLKNFESYAAALAGYTPLIIAANTLGATGGPDGQVFMVAVTRASEISIGIVCSGFVLAGTDLGSSRRKLANSIADLASGISGGFMRMMELARAKTGLPDTQTPRRELVRRIIGLDPAVDQAIGESSELRYNLPILQGAVCGLFASADGWRTTASHLEVLPDEEAQRQAGIILSILPEKLRSILVAGTRARWLEDPPSLYKSCEDARRALLALPADTPSLRLLADQTARLLDGITGVLDGLALLVDAPVQPIRDDRKFQLKAADRLPGAVNAARAMMAFGSAALFWVVTAWPNGALAMTFVSIAVLLLSPRGDQAPTAAMGFALGSMIAIPFAATVKFAVLPNFETFFAFCLVFGFYLVPVGIGVAQTQRPALSGMSTVMGFIFVFLLDPENTITYNTLQFYNSALAIFAGCAAASLSFYLLPPLSPALRAGRLIEFARRDVRDTAVAAFPPTQKEWKQRMYSRLAALPDKASRVCSTQLLSAMSVGSEIIRLRALESALALAPELDAALTSLAKGNSQAAISQFTTLDRRLAAVPVSERDAQLALQARASILIVCETIRQHAGYFDAGASP